MGSRRRHKHPLNLAIGPIANSAHVTQEAEVHPPSLWVESPQFLAALAVECHENVEGRGIVEHAVDGEWCPSVVVEVEIASHRIGPSRLVDLLIGGAIAPDYAQLIEIVAIDLVGGGIAGATLVGSVVWPIDIAGKCRERERQRCQQGPIDSSVHASPLFV